MLTAEPALPSRVADFVGQWWLVQAKAGRFRRLCAELQQFGATIWAPTEIVVKEDQDSTGRLRRRRCEQLVFPGYVFLCGTPDDCCRAYRSSFRQSIVDIKNQDLFIKQMGHFDCLLQGGSPVRVARPLKAGHYVVVTEGALVGMRGFVESLVPSRVSVVVGLDILGAYRAVELPSTIIEEVSA
jgi:hypothetical protein